MSDRPIRWIQTLFVAALLAASAGLARAADQCGLGIALGQDGQGRPVVSAVMPGGGGAQAGVQVGDVLVAVNGKQVAQIGDNSAILGEMQGPAGSTCKLSLLRGGQQMQLDVKRVELTGIAGMIIAPGPGPGPTPTGPDPAQVGPGPGPAPLPVQPAGPEGPAPQVPDPSGFIHQYPAAVNSGAPPIIRPGTRLVFYGASASIPGSYQQLVQDDNGNWVNDKTGKKYAVRDMPGTAGMGYSMVRVGYTDRHAVAISASDYLLDPTTNIVSYTGGGGMVSNAGCASDYWVHPEVLKKVQQMNQDGVRIVRMPYAINNKRYNAIRFQVENAQGYQAYVYDLDTGLMIFHGSRTQGSRVLTPPIGTTPGQQAGTGAGYTMLVNGWIMEVEQVNVPWANDPMPEWVKQFKQLQYQGVQRTAMPNMMPFDRQMQININVAARGAGWVRYRGAMTVVAQGFPPEQGQTDGACGNASIGGLWIPPQGLARLKQGQVLDSSNVLQIKVVVSSVNQGQVTISEIGNQHRSDLTYNANSGVLAAMVLTQRVGMATTTTSVRLTGQQ